MKENYAGMDYGRGMSNVDHETGIRYGVINQNEVLQAWADSSEPNYHYFCPECEEDLGHEFPEKCSNCDYEIQDDDFDMLEPVEWSVEEKGLYASCGNDDGDIFITKSKYFTYAQFCSPCAPGAGYLMNFYKPEGHSKEQLRIVAGIAPLAYGEAFKSHAEYHGYPKVYCFGHDWFEAQDTGEWIDCPYCKGTGYRDVKDIPHFNKESFVANGGQMHGDDKAVCWACQHNHKHGQIGKVKRMIRKAPYPVFSVETDELVLPTEE